MTAQAAPRSPVFVRIQPNKQPVTTFVYACTPPSRRSRRAGTGRAGGSLVRSGLRGVTGSRSHQEAEQAGEVFAMKAADTAMAAISSFTVIGFAA